MADTQTMIGGQFLTTAVDARDMFTREELTDEQRMFGQTAAEFMRNEVLPNEARLYAHDWDFVRDAAAQGGRPRPAAARDSGSLRRPGPDQDQRGVCRRADRGQPVVCRVDRRAHLDRHAAAGLLRERRAEGEVPAEARQRRDARRLRAHRAAVGLGRARREDHGRRSARTAVTTSSTARRCGSRTAASPICSPSSPRSTARSSRRSSSSARWA